MAWLPDGVMVKKYLEIGLFVLTNVTDRHHMTATAVLDASIARQKLEWRGYQTEESEDRFTVSTQHTNVTDTRTATA